MNRGLTNKRMVTKSSLVNYLKTVTLEIGLFPFMF